MWGNLGTAGHYGQLRVHSCTQVGCTLICCRDRKVLTCVEERPRLSYSGGGGGDGGGGDGGGGGAHRPFALGTAARATNGDAAPQATTGPQGTWRERVNRPVGKC